MKRCFFILVSLLLTSFSLSSEGAEALSTRSQSAASKSQKIIFLIGNSSSGKSTLAAQICAELKEAKAPYSLVSIDTIFGYYKLLNCPGLLEDFFKVNLFGAVDSSLSAGKSVVVELFLNQVLKDVFLFYCKAKALEEDRLGIFFVKLNCSYEVYQERRNKRNQSLNPLDHREWNYPRENYEASSLFQDELIEKAFSEGTPESWRIIPYDSSEEGFESLFSKLWGL